MTANRTPPTESNTPAGIAGDTYAARIAEEIAALYTGRVNQVSSIGGSANAITGVNAPPLAAAYQVGEAFRFTPGANNTSSVTVNWDARGAVALVDEDGNALVADDLVAGRAVTCWYNGTHMRLGAPTLRALLAALAADIADASLWEVIGDTIVGSPVASIEHTFTAGDYAAIVCRIGGASSSGNGVSFVARLRNTATNLLNLQIGAAALNNANLQTMHIDFTIDLVSGTRHYYGFARGQNNGSVMTAVENAGNNALAADRVFYQYDSGNIDAGRFITYGLKKPT